MSRLQINLKKAFITIGCQAIPNIAYVFRDVARTQTSGWLAETPKRPHSSSSLRERSLLVALPSTLPVKMPLQYWARYFASLP